ncbi:Kelch-like protein 10 [Fusarium torreyae]|uniref:Kelch-like protein 10 n=1 Tax=Fusarium torreyae TaxID=1237075 RepID=A0A9W8SDI2_9HYPO|nr:Kelch-like protein 10 [Fusarium torreyae]
MPEDDPDILECFLEFLYTGTYSDGVNSTWGQPSVEALMDHETVQRSLQVPAGAEQENSNCEALDENEDPEEEYNEYYGENSHASTEEDEDDQRETAKRMEDLSLLPKTEAIQQLARLRDDMTLPLRLYVMADKYDVAALRLLTRDRFYRVAELVWEEAESFPDIVDEVYQTTPPGETAMREIVCRLVGARILDSQVRDKMRPLMVKHGDFAVGVLEYAIHRGILL